MPMSAATIPGGEMLACTLAHSKLQSNVQYVPVYVREANYPNIVTSNSL